MKTKKFLLATSGATVDGRTIDADWLRQMAADYDPKTYGARLNIEHIRGISGEKPFRAYGDVLELSVEENHEVTIGGKAEKRTALFGVFDVNDDAKQLNDAGQKVYPSIEVDPNFAGKGRAYLMGCALTDSPASIGTDRLTFNRIAPGHATVSEGEHLAAQLELVPDAPAADAAAQEVKGFFSKLTEMLSGAAPKQVEQPKPAEPQAFDATAFAKGLGETLEAAFTKQGQASDAKFAELTGKVEALAQSIETTADPNQSKRPASTGPAGNYSRTDC